MRKLFRNFIFNMMREDLLEFINENENYLADLIQQEMISLDNKIPEEQMFIDIRMTKLGNEVFRAILRVTKTFLKEDKH